MVKQRMSTVDAVAEVACLRRLIGMRVSNIYDVNAKVGLCTQLAVCSKVGPHLDRASPGPPGRRPI